MEHSGRVHLLVLQLRLIFSGIMAGFLTYIPADPLQTVLQSGMQERLYVIGDKEDECWEL